PADAAQHAFLARQPPRHLESVLVLDLHHLIHDIQVQNVRNEPGAQPLELVLARLQLLPLLALGNDRAVHALDGHGPERRLTLLDDLANAGDGATRADAADEDVRLAVGVGPDL